MTVFYSRPCPANCVRQSVRRGSICRTLEPAESAILRIIQQTAQHWTETLLPPSQSEQEGTDEGSIWIRREGFDDSIWIHDEQHTPCGDSEGREEVQ